MDVRIRALLLLVFLLAASAAAADLVSSTYDFQYQNPYSTAAANQLPATSFPTTFNVPQFNPNLGSLQYVIIQYQGAWGGYFWVNNGDLTPETLSGQQFASLNLTTNSGADALATVGGSSINKYFLSVPAGATVYYTSNAGDNSTPPTLPPNAGANIWTGNSGALASENYSADLAPWEGSGTNPVRVDMAGGVNTGGGANTSSQSYGYGAFHFTIQYDYDTSVPEPSTLGLGAMCLLGLGFWRRRKR